MRRRSEPRAATPGASGDREASRTGAFARRERRSVETLHARIQQFLSLQFDLLNDPALVRELARIGERYK